jgi:predicted DNA-binding protein (UPF0251 family)
MARPKCPRHVNGLPFNNHFKPKGIPMSALKEVVLTVDEFEALRLADYEGLYHQQAAKEMNVSRQTFGRIMESAHKKVADVIIHGRALKIEGGVFKTTEKRRFKCFECLHEWDLPSGAGRPSRCPSCKGRKIRAYSDMEKVASNHFSTGKT